MLSPMDLNGSVCVVTGAAAGIGRACARRFAEAGATVVFADLDEVGAREAAAAVGQHARRVDVGAEASIKALIDWTEAEIGPIDLFFSNAGIAFGGGPEVDDAQWDRMWRINTMSHVWAARHLIPRMEERGSGYLLSTSSAAGLLMEANSAPYTVTKHAAVAFAEWIAVNHGDAITVSVLCPQGVNTAMVAGLPDDSKAAVSRDGLLEPEQVADDVLAAVNDERFLILPHPMVADYERMRAGDRDRWLAAMRKYR